MIFCAPMLLVLYPSVKLFCFLLPCAALLGAVAGYLGGLFSYFTEVAHYKLNMFQLGDFSSAMATDEEKCKLAKLLQGLEVPEVKISERGLGLVKEFEQKFGSEIEADTMDDMGEYKNPYVPDKGLLEENERKLRELLAESKRAKREEKDNSNLFDADPKRPWRTHSSKEKLLRIDSELKRHSERGSQAVSPMAEDDMRELVEACRQETRAAPALGADRLRETVDEARKHLPNFQYRRIENTTATAICPDAHQLVAEPQTVVHEQ